MKHARNDYNRIQDPAGLIPKDEPVFLLRAQDEHAPAAVEFWAVAAMENGASDAIYQAAMQQAEEMRNWQKEHGMKTPDMPET